MTHMLPRFFTTSETPQTRDLGLKTSESRETMDRRHIVQLLDANMRSRVSAFCLGREFEGTRECCRLAQVTAEYPPDDSQPAGAARRGARPRKSVTGKWPSLIDFCCFRSHSNANGRPLQDNGRKLRKSINRRKANGCAMSTSTSSTLLHGQHSRTVSPAKQQAGAKVQRRRKRSSLHTPRPAEGLCVLLQRLSVTGYSHAYP